MGVISTALKHLIAAGITGAALIIAIQEIEDAGIEHSEERNLTPRQLRNQRYYDNKRLKGVLKASETSYSDATPLDGSNGFPDPSLTSLIPTKEKPPKGGKKKNTPVILPDWMPLQAWEAFRQMREKIRKPLTAYAERLAITKLEKFRMKGHDPTEILNQSTFSDYQDLYEPKKNGHHAGINHSKTTDSLTALYRAGNRNGSGRGVESGEFQAGGSEIRGFAETLIGGALEAEPRTDASD